MILAGRCLVDESPGTLEEAANRVIGSAKRALFFPEAYSESARKSLEDPDDSAAVDLVFFSRPLPAWHLTNDGCPFVLDTATTSPWVGGDCNCVDINDKAIGKVWDYARRIQPANNAFRVRIDITRRKSIASVSTSICNDGSVSSYLSWNGPVDSASPIPRIAELLELATDDLLADRSNCEPGRERRMYTGLSVESFPERMQTGINRIDFPFEELTAEIYVANSLEPPFDATVYDQERPTLNGISRDWTTEFPAYYRDGVDVYSRPSDIPEDVGEVRFPITQIDGNNNLLPKLQIDVVHTDSCSFLEFLTAKDKATLKKYARIAGVELEMWKEDLANRWLA